MSQPEPEAFCSRRNHWQNSGLFPCQWPGYWDAAEIIAGDIQEQRILVHNIVGELLLRVFVIGIRVEEQVIRRVVAVILNAEIAVSGIIEDVVPHLACGGLPSGPLNPHHGFSC